MTLDSSELLRIHPTLVSIGNPSWLRSLSLMVL